ncbi:MAG: HAD family hydrolase [Mariniphaga sp.]|nr:HAD family hydrolase [Mariniphaga sp.]
MKKTFLELKTIIFDLDDTLVLERDYVISGFHAVSSYCQQKYYANEEQVFNLLWGEFSAGKRGKLFDLLIGETHGLNASVEELISVYRDHKPNIRLVEGVESLIRLLKKEKKAALISDGYLDTQQKKLEALGIKQLFDSVMFTDSLGRDNWKPSPKPFINVLKDLGENPEDSVYIADNPQKDFIFPNKSGMKSIRVKYENGIYSNLKPESIKHAPMLTVTSIAELRNILLDE